MTTVSHSRAVPLAQLSAKERERLEAKLVEIFLASFIGPSHAEVVEHFIYRGPKLQLRLFFDAQDEIVGFTSASITRYRIGRRKHDVVDAGFYTLPSVRGGGATGLRGTFFHALRHMLWHPRASISSVGLGLTPASYRRLARTLPSFFPRQGVPTPPEAEELVATVLQSKALEPVGDDPWVVRRTRSSVLPREPERLECSQCLATDPDACYFMERNPGYLEGDALVTYFNLDLRTSVASSARVLAGF